MSYLGRIEVKISDKINVNNAKSKLAICHDRKQDIQVKLHQSQKCINVSDLNVQSAWNKVDKIADYIIENEYDIMWNLDV